MSFVQAEKMKEIAHTFIATGYILSLFSKLPFLNIITEVLLIHVPEINKKQERHRLVDLEYQFIIYHVVVCYNVHSLSCTLCFYMIGFINTVDFM